MAECADCKHFYKPSLECRLYPPERGLFNRTYSFYWCGQFEPREEDLTKEDLLKYYEELDSGRDDDRR